DRALGRVSFTGTLLPGQTYVSTLNATLPSVTPGPYRVIVRADIFNQVYEDLNDANNATTSAGTTAVSAEPLPPGVALETTLSAGQERLYQVSAPLDQTLRVTARAGDDRAANELYVRFGAAPTSAVFDAASSAGLAPQQVAVIPATQPGVYYVLVRGHT